MSTETDTKSEPESPAEPTSTGVSEAQLPSPPDSVTVIPASDWKAQESLSDSLRSIQDGRRMAASAVFSIASAGVKMLEDELTSARTDRQSADARERQTLEKYYSEKERAAVSGAHLSDATETSRLRSVMQNLASILVGAAITLYVAPCPGGDAISTGGISPRYVAAAFAIVGGILYIATFRFRASGPANRGSSDVV